MRREGVRRASATSTARSVLKSLLMVAALGLAGVWHPTRAGAVIAPAEAEAVRGMEAELRTELPEAGFTAYFAPRGVRLVGAASSWRLELDVVATAAEREEALAPARLAAGPERVEYAFEHGIDAWFVGDAAGLEQGFLLRAAAAEGTTWIDLAIGGDLAPRASTEGAGVEFVGATEAPAVRLDLIGAVDAAGRDLPARLTLADAERVRVAIEAERAELPVRVTTLLAPAPRAGEGAVALAPGLAPSRDDEPLEPLVALGQGFVAESEPNNTPGTADPVAGPDAAILGHIYPNGDVDYFAFPASGGDRVYVATMTSFSASANFDSVVTVFAPDGATVVEADNDDGTFGTSSSVVAGALLPGAGPAIYFVEVRNNSATAQIRPYHLHLRVQRGATPLATEVEANDTPATANPLPADGWVGGTRGSGTDQDWFSVTLSAGDTVYAALDLDPERDTVTWNGRLGIGLFGDAGNLLLAADDTSVTPFNGEAMFLTVKNAGVYYIVVDSAGATFGSYHLSVSVRPHVDEGINCTTYTSTDVPKTIPAGGGLVSSILAVPGSPRIADVDVSIELNHLLMGDIDAHLRSPAGNNNGLFTDIGSTTAGATAQTQMDITLDDEAALPISAFTAQRVMRYQPELSYRLGWFDGENGGGTWQLDLYDDSNNALGGTLTRWSLTICEAPPLPTCPAGIPVTVYSSDFESDAGGFTSSGVGNEWARGTPAGASAPILACHSGTSCWKTDLTGGYNAGSNQDLLSPALSLAGLTGPAIVSWAQIYQIESASFDRAFVDIQNPGGANPARLWDWLDATMFNTIGTPPVTIQESAGWGIHVRDIGAYLGQNVQLRFHLDTDTSVQLSGLGIDDVRIVACCTPQSCDDNDVCTVDICDAQQGCVHSVGPPPAEITNVQHAADKQTITWDVDPVATSYDVVRGDVSALPVGPGGGDETCFNDLPMATVSDPATPLDNRAFFYVVRGDSGCGSSGYGNEVRYNGVTPILVVPRVTTTCP